MEEGTKLQIAQQGGGIPSVDKEQLSPIPPPAFKRLRKLLEVAPPTQLTTSTAGGDHGGGRMDGARGREQAYGR